MKVYYRDDTGEMIAANYDRDDFAWKNTIQVPHSVLAIDELAPDNKGLCADLAGAYAKRDAQEKGKYYIDPATTTLMEREGWTEYVEDPNG